MEGYEGKMPLDEDSVMTASNLFQLACTEVEGGGDDLNPPYISSAADLLKIVSQMFDAKGKVRFPFRRPSECR